MTTHYAMINDVVAQRQQEMRDHAAAVRLARLARHSFPKTTPARRFTLRKTIRALAFRAA